MILTSILARQRYDGRLSKRGTAIDLPALSTTRRRRPLQRQEVCAWRAIAGVTLADTTASPAEAHERRQALHDSARDVELQLAALRLGASGDDVDELFPLLSELHNLRLQLAETVLRGSGELPPTLQEQLVAEHRQFLTLLHAWRSRHGRRGGAAG